MGSLIILVAEMKEIPIEIASMHAEQNNLKGGVVYGCMYISQGRIPLKGSY